MISKFTNSFLVVILSILFINVSCSDSDDIEVVDDSVEAIDDLDGNESQIIDVQQIQNEAIEKVVSSKKISSSILVKVNNEFESPVNGAQVTIAGQTKITEDGYVLFNQLEVNEDFVGVKITHKDYVTSVKNFTPPKNFAKTLNVVLFTGNSKAVNATTGGELNFDSGVKLAFEENTFVNASGVTYSGEVNVNTYYHNTQNEDYLLAQPGALVGLDDEDGLSALATEGMITVDLVDVSGNEVFIKEGKSVKVTMPANAEAPDTIDLWHLNENYGIWVKTGAAIKNGGIYEFEVTHFSTYNLDYKVDTIEKIDFIVESSSGLVRNKEFQVLVNDIPVSTVQTDANGRFTLLRAPMGDYLLKPILCDGDIDSGNINITSEGEYEFAIPNFEDFTSGKTITLSGRFSNCANFFEEGETVLLNGLLGNGTQFSELVDIRDGSFRADIVLCGEVALEEEISVEVVYEAESFKGNRLFIFEESENSYFLKGNNSKICDLITEGAIIDIDEELLEQLKAEFNLSDDEPITVEYARQIKRISGIDGQGLRLNNLNFKEISDYFVNLKVLGISDTNISNFDRVSNLSSLEGLTIINSNLTDTYISSLSGLTKITNLDLRDNNITDVSSLSGLTNLVSLDLTSNNITDISSLSGLVGLGRLDLRNNNITDVSSLSGLTNLVDLDLRNNNITDISSLSGLTNLRFLNLSSNNITDISSLSDLVSLLSLYLRDNPLLSQSDVEELRNKLPNVNIFDN